MMFTLLMVGSILMGIGVGIAIGSFMEYRKVSNNIMQWIARIIILVGGLMGYYAIKQLGI